MTTPTPPSDAPIGVQLRNVGRTFDGTVEALRDVETTIGAGRFVAFIGPSGCGKTTLLRLLGGLDRPTAGELQFDGGPPPRGAIGYAFQESRLLPWRTVLRNVELPLELAGVPAGERRAAARSLIDMVGLGDFADTRPHALSGGMRMRVAIARALVTRPRLLLLDEPFGALDEITRTDLDDELRRIWLRTPMTVVLITHSISEAVYLADRVVVLAPRPGRIIDDFEVGIAHADRSPDVRTGPDFAALVARAQTALERGVREAAR